MLNLLYAVMTSLGIPNPDVNVELTGLKGSVTYVRTLTTIFLLGLLLTGSQIRAQILKPVQWSYGAKRVSATEAILFFKATIEDGWHVYSQHVPEGGPVKTSFSFAPAKDYLPIGPTQEPKPMVRMEKAFNDMEIAFFEHSVIFQQKIHLKAVQVVVKGTLEFMSCNDEQCLPPEDIEFSIPVK